MYSSCYTTLTAPAPAVHILRRHAHVLFREPNSSEGLTSRQKLTVRDYVDAHLGENISLDDLAASVALSRFHFACKFRQSVGTNPHEFVLQQRLVRARAMLSRTNAPLPDVAASCGFADQSHMNRVFRKRVGQTPAASSAPPVTGRGPRITSRPLSGFRPTAGRAARDDLQWQRGKAWAFEQAMSALSGRRGLHGRVASCWVEGAASVNGGQAGR